MKLPPSSHHQVLTVLHALTMAVVAAVEQGGECGADGGTLFAAMSSHGCTIDQFTNLVGGLVGAGILCRVGERYYLGDLGLEITLKGATVA